MKKLLDETTDELTRSLLVAGVMHRPPPGNKAKLILALGAGGSVGLLSSKAFAWLSTGAGKVTVVSVALGVASAAYVASPLWSDADVEAVTTTYAPRAAEEAPEVRELRSAALDSAQPALAVAPLLPSQPSASAAGDAAQPPRVEAEQNLMRAKSSATKRSKTRRTRATESGPQPAVETPPAVGALEPSEPETVAAQAADRSRLEAEVQLVDDMHWAARRNDRDALGRFVATYRQQFPNGQLQQEVAEFAARLDRVEAQ